MVTILAPDGRVVSKSKNLRGILCYAREHGVSAVSAMRASDGEDHNAGMLRVDFCDGCYTITRFASFNVLCDWIKRRRSWRGAPVAITRV